MIGRAGWAGTCSVASLPMRNWNYFRCLKSPYFSIGCEPTYEELKLYTSFFYYLNYICCEPTYEELKHWKKITNIDCKKSVASLPMRNWNKRTFTPSVTSNTGCEPTYEELKRNIYRLNFIFDNKLRAYLWGIETLSDDKNICKKDISCEPTYEELKQKLQLIQELFLKLVASLPMRNWNRLVGIMNEIHIELRAYLWGIETLCRSRDISVLKSCEPTYEELKPMLSSGCATALLRCEPTYEELKPTSLRSRE